MVRLKHESIIPSLAWIMNGLYITQTAAFTYG
jgi:hypothetical protein